MGEEIAVLAVAIFLAALLFLWVAGVVRRLRQRSRDKKEGIRPKGWLSGEKKDDDWTAPGP